MIDCNINFESEEDFIRANFKEFFSDLKESGIINDYVESVFGRKNLKDHFSYTITDPYSKLKDFKFYIQVTNDCLGNQILIWAQKEFNEVENEYIRYIAKFNLEIGNIKYLYIYYDLNNSNSNIDKPDIEYEKYELDYKEIFRTLFEIIRNNICGNSI